MREVHNLLLCVFFLINGAIFFGMLNDLSKMVAIIEAEIQTFFFNLWLLIPVSPTLSHGEEVVWISMKCLFFTLE
jgi:hypothetical protein